MTELRERSLYWRWRALSEGIPSSRLAGIMLVATVDGLFQAFGIASILPFISVLADPGLAIVSPWFAAVQTYLPFLNEDNLLFATGLFAFAVLVLSNALTMLNYWLSLQLFNQHRHRLSLTLLSSFLGQDLLAFNRRKVSDMSATVLSKVESVVIETLMAGVRVLADLIVIVAITALLMSVNPSATLIVLLLLSSGYMAIHQFTVREMERLGASHAEAEADMFAGVSQALALFKEARLGHRIGYFIERFAIPSRRVVAVTNRYEMLTFLPAQVLELLTFGLMLGLALYLTGDSGDGSSVIALIAFFAFAAYRLIPILTSLLDGFEIFRYGVSVVDNVLDALDQRHLPLPAEKRACDPRITVNRGIELLDLGFRYPESQIDTFNGITATIPANRLTCVIGPSGAGKSTLLDILSGLLRPSAGQLLIDGRPLDPGDLPRWQAAIGYVPQKVQLLNGSLAENIALGEATIDMARVKAAAASATIDRLAVEQLPEGYGTVIGDGNHALSGGERQRIGIARALYRQPGLLLLDEATNELDAATEALVLQRVMCSDTRTIVFASHKREIRERADYVIELPGRFT